MISFLLTSVGYGQVDLNHIRNLYLHENNKENIEYISKINPESDNANEKYVLMAYKGTCTSMMAKFTFSPFAKFSYFSEGVKLIELSISKNKSVENVFLRLLVQINSPGFLNYHSEIENDLNFMIENIEKSSLSLSVKKTMIKKIVDSEYVSDKIVILKNVNL